jgi:hypothetical protein
MVTSENMGTRPCETYPYHLTCDISTASPVVTGLAVQAATDLLFLATAQRFTSCSVTLRPCRDDCSTAPWGISGYGYPQWWDSGYPWPVNRGGGIWVNMVCGICGDGCSCASVSQVLLPGPVQSISQVLVDGVVLTPGVDYRVDDYRKLVRLGGAEWPVCNNYNLADTEEGTWSVTTVYGEPFPEDGLGVIAMGQLVCAFIVALTGGECGLPSNITELTRQGITMSFNDVNEVLETGFTGLGWVDQFIRRYNPSGLAARSFVYDLDGPTYRAVGTA